MRFRTRSAHWSPSRKLLVATALSVMGLPAASLVLPIGGGSRADGAELQRVSVEPSTFKLTGVRERLQLVVTGHYADGSTKDLTDRVEYRAADTQVAEVVGSVVQPRGDGKTTVSAALAGSQIAGEAVVEVEGQGDPQPVSFAFDMLPALSKQGCNAGACHGSPSGKGGFRLSLRAFDPKLDQETLIREEFGRRTNPLDPDASLLLRKPLMQTPHGGGRQMRKSDAPYEVMRDWIAEGCRLDPDDAARCVGLDVLPGEQRVLRHPAWRQQLTVLARFSDGAVRDVTPLSVFTSSDEQVASVSPGGVVTGNQRGEAAIVVRYLEFIESKFLTFVRDVDGFAWTDPPQSNYIDKHVHDKLRQLQYLPSPICEDEEFLRRVYLDVVGTLPSLEQTRAFLADPSAGKRSALIDELLERVEHAEFWALKWGDVLRLTSGQVGADGVHKYHRWIVQATRDNMPYDQFARELLTATGSTLANPPANFYRTAGDPFDCVETISQLFLGARLQCAKCHNHPFERWTQDNYYGMAAFFNRVQRTKSRRGDELFIWASDSGDVTQPRTGQKMAPWAPGAEQLSDARDRRHAFVEWLTAADNPYFAKIEVNRIWSHLLGRGIVEPSDDFRDSNPPANAALLDALAADFVRHRYDRRHIIRTILNSNTYQASYKPLPMNEGDTKYFSHFQPRMLSAEQLLDAICRVTGVPESFSGLPAGTRATQIPAPDLVKSEFLKAFGQPERQTACACERSSESNLGMAIQFFNGDLIHGKISSSAARFRQGETAGKDDAEIVEELYLAAVCRAPTSVELETAAKHIVAKRGDLELANRDARQQAAELQRRARQMRVDAETKLREPKMAAVPEALRADLAAALAAEPEKRTEVQKYLVSKLGSLVAVKPEEVDAALGEAGKKQLEQLASEVKKIEGSILPLEQSRRIALEDICWALLNSNEFLFQH